jgi:hypothetical protein
MSVPIALPSVADQSVLPANCPVTFHDTLAARRKIKMPWLGFDFTNKMIFPIIAP